MPTKMPRAAYAWFIGSLIVVIADRVFKRLALNGAHADHGPVDFLLFRNTGIAFSLPLPPVVYWVLTVPIFFVITYFFVRAWRYGHRVRAGILAAVLLGAASNLADRAQFGWTTDYLIFFNRSAVNIADGMIIVGLLALGWGNGGHETSDKKESPAA